VLEWREEDEGLPTQCKNDSAHSINSASVRIHNVRDPNTRKVQEETIPTGENFKTETVVIEAAANSEGEVDKSWPIPVGVLSMYYVSDASNTGDNLEMFIAPDTTIGVTTALTSAGATTISVDSSVTDNTMKGYYLKITDGTNTDDLGMVLAVDKDAGTVTVSAAAVNEFAAGTSSIQQTVKMVENYEIGEPWEYEIGDSKIGASHIPANTVVRARYINNDASNAKRLVVKIEYLY
jgi:hypothetical protein